MRTKQDAFGYVENVIDAIIEKMNGVISLSGKKFFKHILPLYMSMRGRYNFSNMSRYDFYNEKSYRHQFEQEFDFMKFNTQTIQLYCNQELIAAFDPSHIRKSGKHTPHAGMFWNGCEQQSKYGLEIGCMAIVDVAHQTAFSFEAWQTPTAKELKSMGKTLVDHYADCIKKAVSGLRELGIQYLAVDGYFAKEKFVNEVENNSSLHVISKLRTDANLMYLFKGEQHKGKGRKKKYHSKVNVKNIDKRKIKCFLKDDQKALYAGRVYSIQLKKEIQLVYIEQLKNAKPTGIYALLFTTDLSLNPEKIHHYYTLRFQIEFLLRDAKQHVGLEDCQARSENKLHFHFNASLTTVSFAKAMFHLPVQKQENTNFSMNDIKAMMFNELFAKRIFSNLGLELSCEKIKQV
ncbi:MAG: transposase, partial [Bacteroidia bacterium]